MNMTFFVLPSRNVRVEEDVFRSEVENTRLGLVEEEPSVAPFEVGEFGRADGYAEGGGEGLADDSNGVGCDGRLIKALEVEERVYRLENDDVNVIETILDKDGSAP